jgi:hypothetical protein
MTGEEMKQRFIQFASQGELLDKKDPNYIHWFNKDEEWFFTNKRLMFALKNEDVAMEWLKRL